MTRNRTRTVKDGDACNGAYLIYVRKPDNLDNSLEVVALMLLARSKYPAQRMLESSLFHLTAQITQADPADIDQPIVGVLVHALLLHTWPRGRARRIAGPIPAHF
jgi:hypothetical protein